MENALARRIEMLGVVLSAAIGAAFIVTAALRLTTPYALEWMEGGMAMHAVRLAAGEPLYAAPSIDWTPFIYPPFYPWITSWLLRSGIGPLTAGRMISLVATLGSAGVIASVAGERTGRRAAGLVAGSLFLATYSVSGFWFDLARVDSLALFLAVGAIAVTSRPGRLGELPAGLIGGVMMTLALLTKQTFMPVGLALAAALLIAPGRRRAGVAYALAFTTTLTASVTWLQHATEGWFLTYVYRLPAAHAAPLAQTIASVGEMARTLPAAALVVVAAPFLAEDTGERTSWWRYLHDPWVLTGAAAIVSSAWSRAHAGSYENVLIPAYWFGVLGFSCALLGGRTRASVRPVLAAALVLQAALCVFVPAGQIPTPGDRERATRLLGLLAEAPGAVFFPDRPLAVSQAGHPPHAHAMALRDVARAGLDDLPPVDVDGAYAAERFTAVIVRPGDITAALLEHYVEAPRLTEAIRSAPFPVTGWYSRQLRAFRLRKNTDSR